MTNEPTGTEELIITHEKRNAWEIDLKFQRVELICVYGLVFFFSFFYSTLLLLHRNLILALRFRWISFLAGELTRF